MEWFLGIAGFKSFVFQVVMLCILTYVFVMVSTHTVECFKVKVTKKILFGNIVFNMIFAYLVLAFVANLEISDDGYQLLNLKISSHQNDVVLNEMITDFKKDGKITRSEYDHICERVSYLNSDSYKKIMFK